MAECLNSLINVQVGPSSLFDLDHISHNLTQLNHQIDRSGDLRAKFDLQFLKYMAFWFMFVLIN